MTIDVKTRETFDKSVEALLATEAGKEANMYTVRRDLLTEVLG